MLDVCPMNNSSVALLKTSPGWATIVYEMLSTLMAGGCVVTDSLCRRDIVRLAQTIAGAHDTATRPITTLLSSGAVLEELLSTTWVAFPDLKVRAQDSLQHIMNVGAGMDMTLCKKLAAEFSAQVHNLYGTTESAGTTWTFRADIDRFWRSKRVPAGWPQPGVKVVLLRPGSLEPATHGETGEICIGGPYLSLGYKHEHGQNTTRFIQLDEDRFYRSGDIGRWVQTGGGEVLEVLGRVDRQTNIRGIRAQPEEMEALLRNVPGILDTAVVPSGELGLVAYYITCNGAQQEPTQVAAKAALVDALPAEMQPVAIVPLEKMPLLPNGKVDLAMLTSRSLDDVASRYVEVVDSLGRMAKVGRGAALEMEMCDAARGWALLFLVSYHWVYGSGVEGHDGISWKVPPRLLAMTLVCWGEWSMLLFVASSALRDRAQALDRLPVQLRQDVFIVVLYLACYWPLPQLLDWAWHYILLNPDVGHVAVGSQHRWYLLFMLGCRILHHLVFCPIVKGFHTSKWSLCIGLTSAAILGYLASCDPINLCPGGVAPGSWYHRALPFLFDVEGDQEAMSKAMAAGQCSILAAWKFEKLRSMFPAYALTWWLSGDSGMIRLFFDARRGARNAAVAASVTLGFVVCISQAGAHKTEQMVARHQDWGAIAVNWCLATLFLLTFGLAAGNPALQMSLLPYAGRYSLGAYLLNSWVIGCNAQGKWGLCGFSFLGHQLVPDMVDIWQWLANHNAPIAMAALLMLYPQWFLLTIAPLFNAVLVRIFSVPTWCLP
eukprot:TRINITY_DN3078_c0_g2_i5.p1 TRINITY_DN3078_c0_g2~~TRINITY_DN3078_c0_g2_i5.p1  ORF type:complete len:773 (+),score=108.53 TRINITY_DN3078_c0_g2_i5:2337-4655(+)